MKREKVREEGKMGMIADAEVPFEINRNFVLIGMYMYIFTIYHLDSSLQSQSFSCKSLKNQLILVFRYHNLESKIYR